MRSTAGPQLITHLPIDRKSREPLYQQIYEGYRRAILAGHLRPGQRIPSTRALAAELGVSRLPVLAAYEQLLNEGYFDGRRGSGTYVNADFVGGRKGALQKVPTDRLDQGLRPFRVSAPALDQFPRGAWARIIARQAHAMPAELMGYGDPAGYLPLREQIAEYLRTARAVRCEASHVLVVSSSQSALQICAATLVPPGSAVGIEEPGYPGARAALTVRGASMAHIPVDDEGIDVGALAATSVRAVYVTPSHQYPLGVSMTAARRVALLAWAAQTDGWVIEDDYDSEYRYVSRPLGALQGMDAHERVVYIGTFSKVLFPALRVGYMVVPPRLWDTFVHARDALDIFSPTLMQLALTDFLAEGRFARHIRRMRDIYRRRRDALLAGLARHCDGRLTVHNADAGLHVPVWLPDGVPDLDVVRQLERRGLAPAALSTCYGGPSPRQGLLLGFGGADERTLDRATRTLG
ncbi:MAG TPA: PLP-dependent aminotransferase family protein, partial [Gemmatimonadaceae bacterium]|nr:PLP-dependent aminotransferase family protein [Gemmatimonadaceae bacterium]